MLLVAVFFGLLVGGVAAGRDRSFFGWFCISMITSPVIACVLLLVLPNLAKEAEQKAAEDRRHAELLAVLSRNAK